MAKLPQHEERMIDFIDWCLCNDLCIWLEHKLNRASAVITLYDELLEICTKYIDKAKGESDDIFHAGPKKLAKDLVIYLNIKCIGNHYEVLAIEQHLHKDYGGYFLDLVNLIESESIKELSSNISNDIEVTWSSLIERPILPMLGFSQYFCWVTENYIKDVHFKPLVKPKMFNDEMWSSWLNCRYNESVLDKEIPQDESNEIIKRWNDASKNNYGLSGMIQGFLFDADSTDIILDGQNVRDTYVIYLPKEIDEERFDSLMRDIKTRIFERNKKIKTIRDYLTWYLPTSLRNGIYKRQLVTQKNQIIAYCAALLCDIFYTNRDAYNASGKSSVEVTSFITAAEVACLYLEDYGFEYSPDTVIKYHRRLFNKITPGFKMSF